MSLRRVTRWRYLTLLLPILITMLVLHTNSNPEALRRRYNNLYWTPTVNLNLSNYVLPNVRTLLMKPDCSDKIFLLIVVHSNIPNFGARQCIREAWGNSTDFNYQHFASLHAHMQGRYLEPLPDRLEFYKEYIERNKGSAGKINLPVRVVFLVGKTSNSAFQTLLHAEQQQYGDIVQQDFVDTYYNLTIKSVMMLKWLAHHCPQKIAFLMKCDDDVFINVPNILHVLLGGTIPVYQYNLDLHDSQSVNALASFNRLTVTEKVLVGVEQCGTFPESDVHKKFYVPYSMFKGRVYPPYLSGNSYVMSGDVIPEMYKMALQTPLFPFEDIFLTGFCAERLNLHRQHNPLFSQSKWDYYYHSINYADRICFLKGSIMQHWKSEDLLEMYKAVKNTDIKCAPPNNKFEKNILRKNPCHFVSNKQD